MMVPRMPALSPASRADRSDEHMEKSLLSPEEAAEALEVGRSSQPLRRQLERVSGRGRLAPSDADRVFGTDAGCRGGSD